MLGAIFHLRLSFLVFLWQNNLIESDHILTNGQNINGIQHIISSKHGYCSLKIGLVLRENQLLEHGLLLVFRLKTNKRYFRCYGYLHQTSNCRSTP